MEGDDEADEETPDCAPAPTDDRRLWAACGALAVVAGAAFSWKVGSPIGFVAVPFVLFGVAAPLFLVRWALLRPRPKLSLRVLAPAIVLVGLLGAREGLFGGFFTLSFQWFHSSSHSDSTTKVEKSTHSPPDPSSGRVAVSVDAKDGSDGQIVGALRDALVRRKWRTTDLTADVVADVSDAWAFLPLYKCADVPYTLTTTAKWNGPVNSGSSTISIEGTISLTMYGIASRRVFNEKIGTMLAEKVTEELSKTLRGD